MKRNKLFFPLGLILISLFLSFAIPAEKLDSHLQRGVDSIQPMDAYNYVKTLENNCCRNRSSRLG